MHFSHPIPNTHAPPKIKIKGRLEEDMIIKRIIVLVVLNVYPSVYSIGSYAWCSSYLLVHNKHTKACWLQTTIIVFSLMVSVDWEFRRVLAGGIS